MHWCMKCLYNRKVLIVNGEAFPVAASTTDMSDTEFIENHYKIVSNKNRVYVRVAATVTAESKSYVNYSRVVEVIVNDIR